MLASRLQISGAMKTYKMQIVLIISMCLFSMSALAQTQQRKPATAQEKELIKIFEEKVKTYVKQREEVRKKIPALSKEATPEQIQTFQTKFLDQIRAVRAPAKKGDIFVPQIADYLRTIIRMEFKGTDRAQLRKTVLEAETKGVPLRVNYPFPETKELTEMPPTLLLEIPQLPKEVKYRFVGRHLLLVDTDNGLIVDYMMNALP